MTTRRPPRAASQDGFSLIELIVVISISSLLMGMGAFAARQFWFQRALLAGQDVIATQLRGLQQRVLSEGVSGRYHGAWFDPGSADWGTVQYQAGVCTSTGTYKLDAGVEVDSVSVATTSADVNFTSPTDVASTCRTQLAAVPDGTDVSFVWFLSRGMATETAGNHIQIVQPRREGRIEQVRVLGLTGRVVKV